jgi:Mg2+ and Co2+ transporter CorA
MRIGLSGSLSVSLENLMSGRPFSVYLCFKELINRLSRKDDEETHASRNLLLLGNETCSDDSEASQEKVLFSTWALTAHQWKLNLRFLKDAFSLRRHNAVAQPGMYTYLPMIHLRRLIVGMRDQSSRARSQSGEINDHFEDLQSQCPSLDQSTLDKTLTEVFEDLDKLDKELNDEIHLIIGAVTVQDSDVNKQQTERATLLTLLAAVYLPLTLVTGIFGMNIKDINDGNPDWRACGEVLAVVAACTIVFVAAYRRWRVWRRGLEGRDQVEHFKIV